MIYATLHMAVVNSVEVVDVTNWKQNLLFETANDKEEKTRSG